MNVRLLLTLSFAVLTVINFDFASGNKKLLKKILKQLEQQQTEISMQQTKLDEIGEISQTLLHTTGNLMVLNYEFDLIERFWT